jgi:cytochrome P450
VLSPTLVEPTSQTQKCPYSYPFHRPSAVEVPPLYEQLRATDPVAKVTLPSGDEGYVVSCHDDAKLVLSDLRFSRAATAELGAPKRTHITPPPGSLFTMHPPEHTRLLPSSRRSSPTAASATCGHEYSRSPTICWTRWWLLSERACR